MDSTDLDLAENENEVSLKNQNQALLQSFLSTHEPEDTWKPSSLGIRCFSQKPKGHIFLTRRILDLCSTDGKRKIEIEYNYSKDFQNEKEFKSKGSSIQNCSFCDTVSLDFDPESTFFDLLMDVQIITVAPENLKLLNKIEDTRPPELVSYTDTGQELEIDSDCEESKIYSSYNLRYSKQEPSSNDHEFCLPSEDQLKDDYEILNGNGQKLIIKTLIKNEVENNSFKSLESLNTYENSKLNTDQTNQSFLSNIRSNSSSSLMSSLSDSGSYCQNFLNTGKCSLFNNSSTSDSRSSSRRSVYTTVEFYPPGENYVEMIDLNSDSTYSYEDFFLKNSSNKENINESKQNSEIDDKEMNRKLTQKEQENKEQTENNTNLEETIKKDENIENKIVKFHPQDQKNEDAGIKIEKTEIENNLEIESTMDSEKEDDEDSPKKKEENVKEMNNTMKGEFKKETFNNNRKLILERTIIKKEKEIEFEKESELLITKKNEEKMSKRVKLESFELTYGENFLDENKNIENILKKEEDYSIDLLENYNLILNVKKKLHSEIKENTCFKKDEKKNFCEIYLSLNTSKDFVEPINKSDQHENNESITEDNFELAPKHGNNEKNQQSYFNSLISKFTGSLNEAEPKIQETLNEKISTEALKNEEITDLNKTDLNFINRSVYNLILKGQDESTAYTSLFSPSNDCTYFPLFKIESDKVNVELLNKQEVKSEDIDHDDLAVFNNEAEWKTDYIDNYPNESIEKIFMDFVEPINKSDQHENNESITEDNFELAPKHGNNEKNQQSYFNSLISKFTGSLNEAEPKIQETLNEKISTEALKNEEITDLNKTDLNFINRSVYNLILKGQDESTAYTSLFSPSNDCTYFPLFKIESDKVNVELLNKQEVKSEDIDHDDLAVFNNEAEWKTDYIDNYPNESIEKIFMDFVEPINKSDQHENNESITEDNFELAPKHGNNEKNQQSYFNSLISKFTGSLNEVEPKIQETLNEKISTEALKNEEITDLNKTDLNFINRSVYNLILKGQDESTAYTSLFSPSNDCTYFPLFKIESDKVNVELLNKQEVKSEDIDHDDLAVFNNEAEWKTDYIDNYPNESIEKIFMDFVEPINKSDQHENNESITEDNFELAPKHGNNEKNQQSYFNSLISKFTGSLNEVEPKIQETLNEKISTEALKNEEITDLNKTDLNFINRSVYNLILKGQDESTAYTSLFSPSNDCTYFPLFKIESDKVNVELLNKQEVKSEDIDHDDLAVFNNEAEWKTDYIDNYPNESIEKIFMDFVEPINKSDQHENNESITEDNFELAPKHGNNEKNQQSYFNSLISKFTGSLNEVEPKIQETLNEKISTEALKNEEITDLNKTDLNFINRSVYNLILKGQDESTAYTSLFSPSNDCTYFPLFKIESDKVNVELLNKQEVKSEDIDHDDLAVFNNEAEWKTDYIDNYPNESIEKIFMDFVEPINKSDQHENNESITEDNFELAPKHGNNEKNQQSYFNSLISKFTGSLNEAEPKIQETLNEKISTEAFTKYSSSNNRFFKLFFKKKDNDQQFSHFDSHNTRINFESSSNDSVFFIFPNDNDHFLSSQTSLINEQIFFSFISHFNLKDISSLNCFMQESFFRSSITLNSCYPFSFDNFDSHNLNEIQQSQFFHDLYSIQNLRIQKPLFDDFAVFYNIKNEYSKFFLLTSEKFEYINNVERSGQSFFYLDEDHRLNVQPQNQSLFRNAFSFILISVGALTIFSHTFN